MKKYILFFVLLAGYISTLFGQAIGSWKAYPALQIATYNVPVGNKIYSLCNGNLFSYNTQDTEVYVYDRLNGLNDADIQFIRYDDTTGKLVLIYENGNVDLVYSDDDISNMKQLKDKNYSNLNINNLAIEGKTAYICTNFGIISLDTEQEIFNSTYDIGLNVKCCLSDGKLIYMSTDEGSYKGDLSLNLLDKNNWKRMGDFTFDQIVSFQNELICLKNNSNLYQLDKDTWTPTVLQNGAFTFLSCNDNMLLTGNASKIYAYTAIGQYKEIVQPNVFNYLTYYKGTYWASQNLHGLQPYTLSGDRLTATLSAIQPDSPVRDYFCNMHYEGNRLLVAGGDLNYNSLNRDGTVMYYEDEKWHNFSEDSIVEKTQQKYNNTTSIAQDPADPMHHYVSSAGHGLYEFKDLKFVKKYDYTNSPLKTILPDDKYPMNYVRCDALQYDSDGNLWMVNTEVDTILVVLKNNGQWTKLYYKELQKAPNATQIFFDSKGRMWMNSKRLDWGGMFFLDYNGTIDDTSDDTHYLRQKFTNQDGVAYDPNYYNCFAQDLDDQIWVGTNIGLFIIADPEKFTQSDFTYTQIKIPRNDGTNYADYLLNGVNISAIAVDAANRKWIGTASDGIYLVSADGQEVLQHFTTENSPLISDEIQSIAVDPQTGEIMIGTFLGLMSYKSDASTPEEELNKNNVKVYPNPVSPDFNGVIAVEGLTQNAEVKITTITGQLVYSGYSNGGTFTWNGRNKSGKRVSSGVYNIISTNAEGKKAIVNRITFIH
ncbi:MAG: regulator [Paraprevotella sp.]|nr:regulator [Paraprevotella sp.]